MNIESHKKTLAIIHLVVGILELVIFSLMGLFFSTFLPFIEREVVEEEGPDAAIIFDFVSSGIFSFIVIVLFLTAIPSIIGAIGTLKNKDWGIVLLLVAGCISLLSFPVGTAIGAYSIWVYVENTRQQKGRYWWGR